MLGIHTNIKNVRTVNVRYPLHNVGITYLKKTMVSAYSVPSLFLGKSMSPYGPCICDSDIQVYTFPDKSYATYAIQN
jgi:hypothetical protein